MTASSLMSTSSCYGEVTRCLQQTDEQKGGGCDPGLTNPPARAFVARAVVFLGPGGQSGQHGHGGSCIMGVEPGGTGAPERNSLSTTTVARPVQAGDIF